MTVGPRSVARAAWGGVLLGRPDVALRVLGGRPDGGARAVLRVLGLRHVVQAALEARGGARVRRAGARVDALHAASGLVLAAVDSRWRRPALADATVAATFAVAGFRCVPGPGRAADR